ASQHVRLDLADGSPLFCALVAERCSRRKTISRQTSETKSLFMTVGQQGNANRPAELTIRGIIIGVVITLVFTAANVYAGLKAALTFSTSIHASVISMAIMRSFRDATIQDNIIVQTVVSVSVSLSSIFFVVTV